MLYETQPDPSITCRIWYSGHEFESEFVRVLNEQCYRLLKEKFDESQSKFPFDPFLRKNSSYLSSQEIVHSINALGISNVELSIQDIESILYTLKCDGKIENTTIHSSTAEKQTQNLYRAIKPMFESSSIVRTSCGICPVFKDCHDDGLITPKTCIYLNKWLDF